MAKVYSAASLSLRWLTVDDSASEHAAQLDGYASALL
jgi:hypothetical protein